MRSIVVEKGGQKFHINMENISYLREKGGYLYLKLIDEPDEIPFKGITADNFLAGNAKAL